MSPRAAVRPPALAGRFYPGDPDALRRAVQGLLRAASERAQQVLDSAHGLPRRRPKALIVPHAGYVYSGAVAATAYARLRPQTPQGPQAPTIRKVVLLGPGHRVYVEGLALPVAERFATPLGELAVDAPLAHALAALPQVERRADVHALEHSLEVHLPFLQTVLSQSGQDPPFTILPLVVGGATPAQVREVLELVWGGPETLVLVSTDLSHFHDYATAQTLDAQTAAAILAHAQAHSCPQLEPEQACGARCVNGLLEFGRGRPLTLELLDLRNSGDTGGDRERVVGYGSFAVEERS